MPKSARFCPNCGASRDGRSPWRRSHTLIEATRLIAVGAGRDLNQVLDVLADQARQLLAADDVELHLASPDDPEQLIRRDRSRLVADPAAAPAGGAYRPGPFIREAIALRGPLFTADFQNDPRTVDADRAIYPSVVAMLTVPLFADDDLVGALRLRWTRPVDLDPEQIEIAQVLARHAAIAVRTARAVEAEREARRRADDLLEQAQRLRGRAEANEARIATIVEHLPCGILILDAGGKVVMVNEAVGRIVGIVPSGLDPLVEQSDAIALRDPRDGKPFAPGKNPVEIALAGTIVDAHEALFRRPHDSADRRAQLSAAPMRDREGGVRGAIVVLTDVTELHNAISERARLDGAVKTARLITHELNNKLTAVTANADLLLSDVEGEARQFAEEIMRGAEDAAEIVARLNQIVKFEETDLGLGEPVLDLKAATAS
jgi:PAS domain-containing protein